MGTYRTMNICDLDYEDFTVISPLVGDPKVLVVGKDSKYNTLEELLTISRQTRARSQCPTPVLAEAVTIRVWY